jgi:alpha-tubulin suppressor-like RCC1 family protein
MVYFFLFSLGQLLQYLTGVDTYGQLAQAVDDNNRNKVLCPRKVLWEDDSPRQVIDVSLGEKHLLVVARHANMEAKVYGSGTNGCGQLGLGHSIDGCNVLSHVCYVVVQVLYFLLVYNLLQFP